MWFTIDKSIFFDLKKSVKVCVVYNPPENSTYCNKIIYEDLSKDLLLRSNSTSPVVFIGDFNSRTGELKDYEVTDEKHTNLAIGRKTFPKQRKNQDKTTNNMGLKLIEFCKAHDLQILNGRSVGDSHGSLSFYDSKQGASAIDISIASDPIVKRIKTFTVNNPVEYTHHCKIELRLDNVICIPEEKEPTYQWINLGDKFKWREDSKPKFQAALKTPQVRKLAIECGQYLDAGLVEPASDKLVSMFLEAAKLSLEVRKTQRTNDTSSAFKHKKKWKKWFDQDCKNQKNITRRLAILKHQRPDDQQIRAQHNAELKTYKKICNQKKNEFEQKQIETLSELSTDPNEFWKQYKQLDDNVKTGEIPKVNGKKWEKYFSNLYDDPSRPNLNPTSPPSDQSTCDPINAKYTKKELDSSRKGQVTCRIHQSNGGSNKKALTKNDKYHLFNQYCAKKLVPWNNHTHPQGGPQR